MIFDIEVKVSLKEGMLNPEATTIERIFLLYLVMMLKMLKL